MRTPAVLVVTALALLPACRPGRPPLLVWEGAGDPHARHLKAATATLAARAPGVRAGTWGESPDASFELLEIGVPEQPHVHETHDLTVVILSGSGVLVAGGRRYHLGSGDVMHIARGRPHYFQPDIAKPVKGLAIFTPRLTEMDWTAHRE
jgi:mannose-6-phosphate isomerase-like protein (cupin superfamily)